MTFPRDAVLRVIIFIDFVFVSMALMADWLPTTYLLNHATIIALGFWSIVNRESVIRVTLLMLIKFFSIIVDIIAIGMYFQTGKYNYSIISHKSYFSMSAFFAMLLLFSKPMMLLLLDQVRKDRLSDAQYHAYAPSGITSDF